jgi:hypothetical protein
LTTNIYKQTPSYVSDRWPCAGSLTFFKKIWCQSISESVGNLLIPSLSELNKFETSYSSLRRLVFRFAFNFAFCDSDLTRAQPSFILIKLNEIYITNVK